MRTIALHLILIIGFIVLACNASENNVGQEGKVKSNLSKNKADLQTSDQETTRPTVTPKRRFRQVRNYIEISGDKENKESLLKSKPYGRIPKQWISLQLTDTGYVEYKPCNGINESIEIKSDTLIINWVLESHGYLIKDITTTKEGYVLQCYENNPNKYVDFNYREINNPSGVYTISWSAMHQEYILLVVPEPNRYKFSFITNPCPENMLPEKEFKEIDFNALK